MFFFIHKAKIHLNKKTRFRSTNITLPFLIKCKCIKIIENLLCSIYVVA